MWWGLTAHRAAKNKKSTPAKCIFCEGAHLANYRGCEYYHRLLKKPNNINNRLNIQYNTVTQSQQQIKPGLSCSDTLKGRRNQEPNMTDPRELMENTNNYLNTNNLLTKFLKEFKAMFQQLTQQNSMMLNMLSTLI
jgi:transcription initiation factor IIF auxiliary subunit